MEEAEKRRERLKAMRMQADQATSSQVTESSLGVPNLVNPLNDSSAGPVSSPAAVRFDYYTDPMAAFSRRGKVSHQVPPDYHTPPRPEVNTTPTPAYRPNSYSQGPGYYHDSQFSTSTQATRPFGMPRVNSPGGFSGPNAYPPGQSMFPPPEVYSGPATGRPMQTTGPFGRPPMNSPGVFSGSNAPPNQYFASNLPGATNFHNQRGGSPSFNHGPGRGQWFNNSPNPRPVRGGSHFQAGRGRNNCFSPSSVQSYRGKSGSHNDVSAEVRPDRFYHKSMVEDPWKILKPVIWRPRNAIIHKYLKSDVTNSNSQKKPKLSDDDTSKSTAAPSLAEYLAASFNEVVDDESS